MGGAGKTMSAKTTAIRVEEFMLHSGVAAQDLLTLLDRGLLPVIINEQGQLLVDTSKISTEKLGKLLLKHRVTSRHSPIPSKELLIALEPLLDEAIELAFAWLAQEQ